jgi:hypothetical protein
LQNTGNNPNSPTHNKAVEQTGNPIMEYYAAIKMNEEDTCKHSPSGFQDLLLRGKSKVQKNL